MGIEKINIVDFFDRRQGLWVEHFQVEINVYFFYNGLYEDDNEEGEHISGYKSYNLKKDDQGEI